MSNLSYCKYIAKNKKRLVLTGVLFFVVCSLAFSGEAKVADSLSAGERIEKASGYFGQLQKWEEAKKWDQFFSNKDDYKEQIYKLLDSLDGSVYQELQASYLLFKVQEFFNETESEKTFDQLIFKIKAIENPDEQTLGFIKGLILELSQKADLTMKRKVSSLYVDLLKGSSSGSFLEKEADYFYKNKDMDNFVAVGNAYLSLIEDKEEFREKALSFLAKSGCYGFGDSCAPYFSEDIFRKLVQANYDFPDSDWYYLRGYNLEQGFEYSKAVKIYESFLKRFPDSPLYNEVLFRLGYINMYKLEDFGSAERYFTMIEDNLPEAKYHLRILTYSRDTEELPYNERVFFTSLFKDKEVSFGGRVQLESLNSRDFLKEKVELKSMSFSPDTGCMVPQGLFLWSGDLGNAKVSTNTPVIATDFNMSGFKVVNLVEKVPEGILGYDAVLANIYKVDTVPGRDDSLCCSKRVDFSYRVTPYMPAGPLRSEWKVTDKQGNLIFISDKGQFSYDFQNPGDYIGELSLYFSGHKVYDETYPFFLNFK